MSDRQKGLLKAVSTVFPNSPQRYCLRHIYANFQTAGFRGEDLKKCMDNAAYSYTKDGFDEAMEEMKKQSEEAWKWLRKIPVEACARFAMDTNCQTDLVVNNLS
jgi:transposase-like protein